MKIPRFIIILFVVLIHNIYVFAQKDENLVVTFKKHSDAVNGLAFTQDGKHIASGGEDKIIYIWDILTGEPIVSIANNYYPVKSLQFADENTILVTSGPDIKLIDFQGKILKTFSGYTTHIWSFDYNLKTQSIVAGSFSNKINVWDFTSGSKKITLSGHEKSTLPVCFSPDGKYIASGSLDRSVRLWNAATGEELKKFIIHSDNIVSVKFHPSGKYFASASFDKTIRLWNVETGKIERTFAGHEKGVLDIDFSPDGYYLASASQDNTVNLWEVFTGNRIYSFIDHQGAVNVVRFSPDGQYIAAGSSDKTVNVWKLNKSIFVSYYFQDKIDEEISQSNLFEPKRKEESKQQFEERERRAKKKLEDIHNNYYLEYLKNKKKFE